MHRMLKSQGISDLGRSLIYAQRNHDPGGGSPREIPYAVSGTSAATARPARALPQRVRRTTRRSVGGRGSRRALRPLDRQARTHAASTRSRWQRGVDRRGCHLARRTYGSSGAIATKPALSGLPGGVPRRALRSRAGVAAFANTTTRSEPPRRSTISSRRPSVGLGSKARPRPAKVAARTVRLGITPEPRSQSRR